MAVKPNNTTPLKGIKVLDLSRVLAGPWAGQMLADLGAEVIKIERPQSGDDTRHWGPPYLEGTEESAYYLCTNRGKRSLTTDISHREGQQIIRQLVAESDVLIENFKVGGLGKYGLDYDSLKAVNPRLIYCSITGFGQTGPYAERAGYDFLLQGMSGLMSITGQPDSEGGEPVKAGVAVTDIFTGLYAANAIQAALLERHRSNLGQHIDLALLDVSVAVLANQAANYLVGDQVPERLGNSHPNIVPYQVFASADGHIILAVGNDRQFSKFCRVAGRPELAEHPHYASNSARVKNRRQVCATIAGLIAGQSSEYWLQQLEQARVPCGPINTIEQVFNDPQIQARQMVQTMPHPQAGAVTLPANPLNFSRSTLNADLAPPTLGQDTVGLLKQQGFSDQQIELLKSQNII